MTSASGEAAVHKAIQPVYPFNTPGEAIVLFQGSLGSIAASNVPGVVELRCTPEIDLVWRIGQERLMPQVLNRFNREDDVELRLDLPEGEHVALGHLRDSTFDGAATRVRGWLDELNIGSATTPLDRVVVHWLNLPRLASPHWIESDGTQRSGRWKADVSGWRLTLDRRKDHRDVWRAIRDDQSVAMTHVMEIRRTDDQPFAAAEVEPIHNALQFGMSFALGRWVPPALPVGFDTRGQRAWGHWAPLFCEQGANHALAWWHYQRDDDLHDYLTRLIPAFADPNRSNTARMLMATAVLVNRTGFVEQRIMTAFSAIEHLAWVRFVLEGGMSKHQYEEELRGAGNRLKRLLEDAHIPIDIDPQVHPALAQFAADKANGGAPLNGPSAVAYVRNRLVHPDARRDDIYRRRPMLSESWFLTRHYLVLLLLHWIGYAGSYQKVLGPGGWAGEVEPVPWV